MQILPGFFHERIGIGGASDQNEGSEEQGCGEDRFHFRLIKDSSRRRKVGKTGRKRARELEACSLRSRLAFFCDAMLPPDLIIHAYSQGIFPMAMPEGDIGWFSPDPRGVLPITDFHVPRGLRRTLKHNPFEVRCDSAFREVMRACADRRETWIDDQIVTGFCELHARGYAHSVETWRDGELVGGCYGVALGAAFFGESMFHRETDASKVALHGLIERLRIGGFDLLDVQWITPHLEQFGAHYIARDEYLEQLRISLKRVAVFPSAVDLPL